jgi:hypothetical protein
LQAAQPHAVSPAAQAVPSESTQAVGEQQVEETSQDANSGVQAGGGGPHVPATQTSAGALQQSPSATQLPPLGAQLLTDWQVPLVSPGWIEQESPVQQSPSAVQVPLVGTHGGAQTPPAQWLEQQSLATEQPAPFRPHATGTSQVKPPAPDSQTVPAQQEPSSAPSQAACSAVQVESVQRRTPSAPGTHGAKLQHWSRNWQTLSGPGPGPGGMQQAGLVAS